MTAQPQFSQFGAPPGPPPGSARVLARLKSIATGGALVSVIAMGLQVALPEPYRPSDILGSAGGSAEKHEMLAKQDTKIAYERGVADATAQAQAKAQIDVAVIQKVLEQRAQALQGQSTMAILADAACLGGQMVASATSSTGMVGADWRRPPPETDWHSGAVALARASCGVGDQVRNQMAESQLDSVRLAAAARGSPMTNGATMPVSGPAIPPRALAAIDAISRPSRHYDYDEVVVKVQRYAAQLPLSVQQRLRANLPSDSSGWDVFVDRARAFDAAMRDG